MFPSYSTHAQLEKWVKVVDFTSHTNGRSKQSRVGMSECCSEQAEKLCPEGSNNLVPSPRLSRKTQKEVVAENDASSSQDPDNYPLHSPWSFWFDRSVKAPRSVDVDPCSVDVLLR